MEYRNNGNRIKLDAEMTAIQLKASKAMQNIVQVLKSLAIQVKKPLKTEMKESQLTASFVETFFSALSEYDDCLAYNANVREDNSCKESYRADYKIDYYEDGQKKFCNFYGEIKPKKSIKSCRQKIYKDLYKLAIFAREEMKVNNLKMVMLSHIVHNCFNFYLMIDKKQYFGLLHLEQIKIPLSLSGFKFNLEDLIMMHKVTQVHRSLCFTQTAETARLRIFPYDGVKQLVTKREGRKRKWCATLYE
ncbi:hypothetical protein A0J61_02929 [Choanephora cucurbitarum]|uniref:Fungal-type protein kinase domain-containing protein n=1 Tax=Choanephora cucurbitarum TaxID=101091 RepID=A0A1C7NJ27_9FUNG|nr:hypothetical protein A0J61_02929 [Choanephora cucurbitarum]